MKLYIALLALLVSCLAGIPAVAQDLHNNAAVPAMASRVAPPCLAPCLYTTGPPGITIGALGINAPAGQTGFAPAANFTITAPCSCNIQISAWLPPGDSVTGILVTIYSGAAAVFSFTSPPPEVYDAIESVTQGSCTAGLPGYDVCTEEVGVYGGLPAGTYYFTLVNATDAFGGPVWWDLNHNNLPGTLPTWIAVGPTKVAVTIPLSLTFTILN
jgi:hypothetical protein